jgi:hypothetical protein
MSLAHTASRWLRRATLPLALVWTAYSGVDHVGPLERHRRNRAPCQRRTRDTDHTYRR